MGKEEWKEIPGYSGYFVSDFGRVKNLKGRILKGGDNGKGYKSVSFAPSKKKVYIHRLVGAAFIPNPENKPCINHLDSNPANNRADNLEWCTHLENMRYANNAGHMKRTKNWLRHLHESQKPKYKKVKATSIKTGDVLEFDNINAVKAYGFQPSCVCRCCKGKRGITQHKGYRWEYVL